MRNVDQASMNCGDNAMTKGLFVLLLACAGAANADVSASASRPGAAGMRFGALICENVSAQPASNRRTVRQFRWDANALLGAGSTIFSSADLGSTVADVNASFSAGNPSVFAQDHLV